MAPQFSSKISILLFLCAIAASHSSNEDRKVYIVYMGNVDKTLQPASHFNKLQNVVDSRFLAKSLVRSYSKSFNGFAANLTAQEREILAGHEDVVSIFPSITYHLQTTRSWDFMGMAENVARNPTVESDTIIAVLDSGVWPESESFNDKGFGPPPKKWKGACNGGKNFTCNNKLIGARHYLGDSARDTIGHGTHTASIAAGNYVKGASFYEIAKGTARGGVPSARIAAYNVCDKSGCPTELLLAAFDDAIHDGVDIITMSIASEARLQLEDDLGVALGSLHALVKGILVVQSAGNEGSRSSITSVMPWIFTVAASTIDRGIVTKVALGNGQTFTGKAVNSFALAGGKSVPLVYGKGVTLKCSESRSCDSECIEPSLVKGKIMLCNDFFGVPRAYNAGAIGVVATDTAFPFPLPFPVDFSQVTPLAASRLDGHAFAAVYNYIESTKSPTLDLLKSESVRNADAPKVATFSSRGPNSIIPDILKPDITAPGVEILAAFSPLASPSDIPGDTRSVKYTISSGTSMSCPHVAGAVAYVKSFHPTWSPSAIKSALMTTASTMDASKDPLAEFSYGAGHINPVKAVSPGLVYETFIEDYIVMFCGMGYDSEVLRSVFGANATCPTGGAPRSPKDLNYPSLTRHIKTSVKTKVVTFSEKFRRTVTNVGPGKSRYTVTTSTSPSYNITVTPSILRFRTAGKKRSFYVTITGNSKYKEIVSAWLEWSDGAQKVRSPIVVYSDNH